MRTIHLFVRQSLRPLLASCGRARRRTAARTLVLLAGVTTSCAVLGGVNEFTPVGPEGGYVDRIVYHPSDASIVYATTTSGFYRSTNAGASWSLVTDRMPNAPRDIAVHPDDPSRVYVVAPSQGVWTSDDAGATLSLLSTFPANADFGTEVEYSADGSVIYVVAGRRVYRSSDHGATWLAGAAADGAGIRKLAVDPFDANRLYVTVDVGQGFESTDGGVSWQPWSMPGGMPNDLAIAKSSPVRIWMATGTGTWFTDNRGGAWTNAMPTQVAMMVTVDPVNPEIVYSGTMGGLLRSTNNGGAWSNIQNNALAGLSTTLAIDPTAPNRLLLGGFEGIAASENNGGAWTARNAGIHAMSVLQLVGSPASDRIYVNTHYAGAFAFGAADGAVLDFTNGGLKQLTGRLSIATRGLFVHSGAADRVLVGGIPQQIARSLDAGAAWHMLTLPGPGTVTGVAGPSADGQTLLAVTDAVVYRTTNGGNNWTEVTSLNTGAYREIATAPSNPAIAYLSARLPAVSQDTLMRSPDGGATWAATAPFPDADVLSLAVDPRNEQTVYAGGANALYKSTDGAASWTALRPFGSAFAPIWAAAIDPQNSTIVYAAGDGRIARSADAGQSWQELAPDPRRRWDARALLVDGQRPHVLYVGMAGHGVRKISIQPDLLLNATTPTTPITAGGSATYTYQIRNAGPYDATRVRSTVQLPADAVSTTVNSTAGSCSVTAALVTCDVEILRTNASFDVTVRTSHPNAGAFPVVAETKGAQPDPQASNNGATSTTTVNAPAPPPPAPPPAPPSSGGGGGGGASLWMLTLLGLAALGRAALSAVGKRL